MINLRKLRGLRVEKNYTQEKLANTVNIPISTYRKKESGESPFKLEEAYEISKVLGKEIESIFFTNEVPEWE